MQELSSSIVDNSSFSLWVVVRQAVYEASHFTGENHAKKFLQQERCKIVLPCTDSSCRIAQLFTLDRGVAGGPNCTLL